MMKILMIRLVKFLKPSIIVKQHLRQASDINLCTERESSLYTWEAVEENTFKDWTNGKG